MGALVFLTLMAAGLFAAFAFMRRTRRGAKLAFSPAIYLAALLPGLGFFLFLQTSPPEAAFVFGMVMLAAIAGFVALWVRELVHLMGLSDDAFPGRHDKVLWFLLLACLPPIGTLAFAVFRRAYWSSEKPAVDSVARDLA